MTLLEVLIALSIFAVSSLFIAQTVRNTIKRKTRMDQDLDIKRSKRNVLEILKKDLAGIHAFFDINFYLNQEYVLSKGLQQAGLSESQKLGVSPLSKSFNFEGTENTLSFTTREFSPKASPEDMVISVSYLVESCDQAQCLFRKTLKRDLNANRMLEKKLSVLEGFQSLRFLYYDSEKAEWETSWDLHKYHDILLTEKKERSILLPSDVRFEIKWQEQEPEYYTLPVSKHFLRVYYQSHISPLVFLEKIQIEQGDSKKDTQPEGAR